MIILLPADAIAMPRGCRADAAMSAMPHLRHAADMLPPPRAAADAYLRYADER